MAVRPGGRKVGPPLAYMLTGLLTKVRLCLCELTAEACLTQLVLQGMGRGEMVTGKGLPAEGSLIRKGLSLAVGRGWEGGGVSVGSERPGGCERVLAVEGFQGS